jgi:hypothetical protein
MKYPGYRLEGPDFPLAVGGVARHFVSEFAVTKR